MYEREIFISVMTIAPIILALYYGYKSGRLHMLLQMLKRDKKE